MRPTGVRCFCGRYDATVRTDEIAIARISGRAHVDCDGHSQYRHVSLDEIAASEPAVDPVRARSAYATTCE